MSGPDLHVFTLKFVALKKTDFFTFSGSKKNLSFFYKKGIMQLFSVDAKGKLISKQNYEVIVSPKKRTKYCKDFCPNS